MKIAAQRVAALLRRPDPAWRAILLYGPDGGLVRERADQLVAAVAGRLDDPFGIAVLSAAQLARQRGLLAEELSSPPLTGGRRVVRIRDAGNETAAALEEALALPAADGLAVIEAGDLPARAALRALCEKAAAAAALPCYVAGAEGTAQLAAEWLKAAGIALDPEAQSWLGETLDGDRLVARRAIEKLVTYAGEERHLTLADVRSAIGEQSERTLDDLVFALGDRDPALVDQALARLFEEGTAAVAILRAGQRHLWRLHLALARVEAGEPPGAVSDQLNPYYKNRPRFLAQMRRWRRDSLERAALALVDAEERIKQTGVPDQALTGTTLLALAAEPPRRR